MCVRVARYLIINFNTDILVGYLNVRRVIGVAYVSACRKSVVDWVANDDLSDPPVPPKYVSKHIWKNLVPSR